MVVDLEKEVALLPLYWKNSLERTSLSFIHRILYKDVYRINNLNEILEHEQSYSPGKARASSGYYT